MKGEVNQAEGLSRNTISRQAIGPAQSLRQLKPPTSYHAAQNKPFQRRIDNLTCRLRICIRTGELLPVVGSGSP